MAGEADDLVLRLLREMRESLAELKQGQQRHEHELAALRSDIHEWQETIATASGFAMHANIRNPQLEERIDALAKRGESMEQAR